MADVTLVTTGQADDLTPEDYRDIYMELREHHALREFAALIGTQYSIAYWSKFERGATALTRQAMNELRRAVGLDALALTPGEALADVAADAAVWAVGSAPWRRVVKVGGSERVTVVLNGTCEVANTTANEEQRMERERMVGRVTPVTRRRARANVSLPVETWAVLNERRLARGESWSEFLERATR